MARLELRDTTIYILDGLSGSAIVEEASPGTTDTDCNINTVNTNAATADQVPVGARFTVNTASNVTTYAVTARDPGSGTTVNITFSPAWGTFPPSTDDVITFISQRLEVKIGEGNLTWTEAKEYEYLLDRGNLDTVKEGNEVPVDVSLEFVYEFIKSSSATDITVIDALKQTANASEWVSSSADLCEPYCVDLLAKHCVPCGTEEDEDALLQDFRYESLEYDLEGAVIAVSGKCNVSEATVTRSTDAEC